MQHDVLAALDLFHAVDAHQQAARPLLFFLCDRHGRADERGLTLHHRLRVAQMIRSESRSGGDQIADQIRAAQPRRNFDRSRQHHDFGGDVVLFEKAREDMRIGRGDAFALQRARTLIVEAVGHGDAQSAAPEIQQLHGLEQGPESARLERKPFLFDDVQADQTQIADVFLHQVWNVVIANEQHVERHVLAVAHQLVFTAAVFQAAARQQIQRVVGETAAFLNGDLEAHRVPGRLGATH